MNQNVERRLQLKQRIQTYLQQQRDRDIHELIVRDAELGRGENGQVFQIRFHDPLLKHFLLALKVIEKPSAKEEELQAEVEIMEHISLLVKNKVCPHFACLYWASSFATPSSSFFDKSSGSIPTSSSFSDSSSSTSFFERLKKIRRDRFKSERMMTKESNMTKESKMVQRRGEKKEEKEDEKKKTICLLQELSDESLESYLQKLGRDYLKSTTKDQEEDEIKQGKEIQRITKKLLSCLFQVCFAITALHSRGIAHNDLYSRNILVNYIQEPMPVKYVLEEKKQGFELVWEEELFKIADFGLATADFYGFSFPHLTTVVPPLATHLVPSTSPKTDVAKKVSSNQKDVSLSQDVSLAQDLSLSQHVFENQSLEPYSRDFWSFLLSLESFCTEHHIVNFRFFLRRMKQALRLFRFTKRSDSMAYFSYCFSTRFLQDVPLVLDSFKTLLWVSENEKPNQKIQCFSLVSK